MPAILEPREDYGHRLREVIEARKGVQVPGAFSPVVAMQARAAGFEVLYLSGAAFSASMGMPDLGLFTLTELRDTVEKTVAAAHLPLIVDIDTGFGEVLNVARTVAELEAAGAAAVQIEDQEMPKKCGHLSGKRLIPPEEMAQKVAAAASVRRSCLVVARTDARAVEGIEAAIERARLYLQAGADVVFPEALETEAEFERFAREVQAPLLANMTEFGKGPSINSRRLGEMGYNLVIYPVSALRVALRAVEGFLRQLHAEGDQESALETMLTRAELYQLIGYQDYEAFDAGFATGTGAGNQRE